MASWKTGLQVIRQLVKRYFRDHVGQSAAELAYYLLFSLFPLLIFIYAAISMLHLSPQILADTLGSLFALLFIIDKLFNNIGICFKNSNITLDTDRGNILAHKLHSFGTKRTPD